MSGRNISLGLGLHFRSPDDSVGCLVLAVLPGLYALGLWTLRMFAGEVSIEFAQAFSFFLFSSCSTFWGEDQWKYFLSK